MILHCFSPKMADDEDSEPEVFEIEDFTTASEWERFIAKLEEIIGLWHLDNSESKLSKKDEGNTLAGLTRQDVAEIDPSNKKDESKEQIENEPEWSIQSKQLSFADFNFTFSHHRLSSNSFNTQTGTSKNEGSGDRPSCTVMDMLDVEFDFPSRAHCIARWHGLKEFFILSPSNANEDINTESRSKLLLSSLSVSLSNTKCYVPGFVQIQQRWRRMFWGTCICNGFSSDFEMAYLRNCPPQCNNLSGLLDVFKSKLAIPDRLIPPIMASVRFTYILRWPDTEWVEGPQDFSAAFDSEVGYINLSRQPFGPLQEPISELHLATTWPCLSEETFVDHAEYTDLNPIEAPKWSLRARAAEKCTSLLYDHLLSFLQVCRNSESTAEIIRSLSRNEMNIESYGDITQAFNRLTKTGPISSQGTASTFKKTTNREQMKLKESPIPEDLLNTILLHLFPDSHEDLVQAEERQRILAEEQQQIELESRKNMFRKMKSAPEKSLLSLLTICLSVVNYGYGGVKAFAHLWHEFVLEMRYRYENNIIIPRLALGPPNLNFCLIHQKLQMLNHCIQKKKLHYEQSTQPVSESSSFASLPVKETNRSTSSVIQTDNENRSADFDIDSESEDEFFEAVEEQNDSSMLSSAANITYSRKKEDSSEAEDSPSESLLFGEKVNENSNNVERSGVLKESELKLLQTGEPLCIPVTQEQPLMTEDMLEEHTEIILKLARSENGSKHLAQMQSLSLFSDVQAFKAANPGCIFEDFVRWYSPNDWISGPDTEKEKEDLLKIKAELQKSNENADLKEVVGEEEAEGWDLEFDEQITDEEISSVALNIGDENQPKLLEEGHLSVRMRIPGNLWLDTWHTAVPVPARRQKRLFDYTKEAEKALHFLANLKPAEITTLLFPVFINTAINRILLENESSRSRISSILNQIVNDTSHLGAPCKKDIPKMMNISRQLQIAELAISRIKFLEKQFSKLGSNSDDEELDKSTKEFVSQLLSQPEITIDGGPRGKIGRLVKILVEHNQVQNIKPKDSPAETLSEIIRVPRHKQCSFPTPAGREYILRTSINRPKQSSRPSPQRMFTVITPDEFRLAAAFTRDSTFV